MASVRTSWWRYWLSNKLAIQRSQPRYWRDIGRTGALAVGYAVRSTFWEWSGGSGIFFWRWPKEYQLDLALGLAPQWIGPPPSTLTPQTRLGDAAVCAQLAEKITKLEGRGYLNPGEASSFLNFFAVPKGDSDIRTVFDGTKSGLNDSLFANWFGLPQVEAMTRCLEPGYFCADNDVGEQFYNFPLHPELRPYCGVDLRLLRGPLALILLWSRLVMGLKPSPFQAVRDNRRGKFIVLGDPGQPGNSFGWATIERNYPGMAQYQSGRPWISKRTSDGHIACGVLDYVDDNRTTGHSYEAAWRASTDLAKGYSFLGIQDATRKRRSPSLAPGPWAGAVVRTNDGVRKSVTQERWDKTRKLLQELRLEFDVHATRPLESPGLNRKRLEQVRGFLVYVSRAYTSLKPYLKGIHLTIDGWRPDREDGWRDRLLKEEWISSNLEFSLGDLGAPEFVTPVRRYEMDLRALEQLTEFSTPPELPVRPSGSATAFYGFRDASGHGFGVSVWDPESGVDAQQGIWSESVSRESSNFREAVNLVIKLETMVEEGTLHSGVELFLFTDNYTTESVFYKGDARSQKLFDVVLRLRQLEMKHGLFVHVVWVSGKRMIAQGTDGLSRGDLTTGVMAGDSMLSFVPLHLSVNDRSPAFRDRILDLYLPLESGESWCFLDESSWFTLPFHRDGFFVWTPPPCVADVAVEAAAEAHHIRPWNTHVFIVPSFLTNRWRRQLSKASDLLIVLPFDDAHWGESKEFERLTLAVICPLLRQEPWRVKRSKLRGRFADAVQSM